MINIILSLAIIDTILIYANYKISKSRSAKTKKRAIKYPEISQLLYSPIEGFHYEDSSETELDY